MIAIYLHIPYCKTLCPYCDFVKTRTPGAVPRAFVDAVIREIAAHQGPRKARSVFFGGGTPSLLAPADLADVLGALGKAFDLDGAEITLEANPDDVTPALMRHWRALGVNRVSLGVQSFDEACLRHLGRRHGATQAREACAIVADNFETWNLDLIFGAPPLEAWGRTLEAARALNPPHVAAYGLTYEAGTPFERRRHEAVDEETSLALYRALEAALGDYDHYEISNFAKPGHASRHNLVYWENGEYAGFGTGAYSFLDGIRARNHPGIEDYLRDPGGKSEALALSPQEIRVETVIQYLRLRGGLPRAAYAARFGRDVLEDFGGVLNGLQARGLVEIRTERVRPTAEGFYLNNEIGLALVD